MSNYKIYLKKEADIRQETTNDQNEKIINMLYQSLFSQDKDTSNNNDLKKLEANIKDFREKFEQMKNNSKIISIVRDYKDMSNIYIIDNVNYTDNYVYYPYYMADNFKYDKKFVDDKLVELSEFIKRAKTVLRYASFIRKDTSSCVEGIVLYQLNELALLYDEGRIIPQPLNEDEYVIKYGDSIIIDTSYDFIYNTIKEQVRNCFDINGDHKHIKI